MMKTIALLTLVLAGCGNSGSDYWSDEKDCWCNSWGLCCTSESDGTVGDPGFDSPPTTPLAIRVLEVSGGFGPVQGPLHPLMAEAYESGDDQWIRVIAEPAQEPGVEINASAHPGFFASVAPGSRLEIAEDDLIDSGFWATANELSHAGYGPARADAGSLTIEAREGSASTSRVFELEATFWLPDEEHPILLNSQILNLVFELDGAQ